MERSESHSSPASTVSNTVEGSGLGNVQAATKTEANEVSNPTTPIFYPSSSEKRFLDIKDPKRSSSRPSSVSSIQKSTSTRIPHLQVERKYRNGLNLGMEELRLSVPSIAQWKKPCPTSTNMRLSKGKVLNSAIIYIKELEQERDELVRKIEAMRR
jgi:hypothetical protein